MNARAAFGRWPVLLAGVVVATVTWAAVSFTAAPGSPKAKLTFGPTGHIRIPFDLSRQHIWLRGRVNGSDSVWIVVDTGASASVLDEALARSLGLELTGGHTAHGAGGAAPVQLARNVTLELPGLSIQRPQIGAIDLSAINAQAGRPMQAIVGYELFEACVVRLDYAAGMMDVWERKRAPRDLGGTAVPMKLQHNHPYIEGTVVVPGRAPIRGDFIIDSGSSAAVILDAEVVRRDSLTTAFPRTLAIISRGVGGEVKNRMGRATSFSLGDLTFSAPTVVLPESAGGRFNVPGSVGNIGARILERCTVTFDYGNKKVHFAKGPDFGRSFEGDMSGASLSRTANGYEVRAVAPDSPASEAGIATGDVVTTIDGESARTMDPYRVRALLQREGEQITFEVARGKETRQLKLTLRRLI